MMNLKLDIDARTLRDSTLPPLTVGSKERLRLRFFQREGDARQPTETALEELQTLRIKFGPVDAPPVEGQWKLAAGSGATGWIEHNATADRLKTLMNAATDHAIAEVRKPADGLYLVRYTDDAEHEIEVEENELLPRSFVKARAFEQDGRWWHEVKLVQAPVAWNQSFVRQLVPAPTITRIQTGNEGTINEDGGWGRNEIQRLAFDPEFVGSLQLVFDGRSTRPLGSSSTVDAFQDALNGLFADGVGRFVVSEVDPTGELDIEFVGPLRAAPQDLIEVDVVSFEPGKVEMELDLDRAEIRALTWGRKDTTSVLEIQAILARVPEGEEDPVVQEKIPLLRTEVLLRRENITDDLATALELDWLRPPEPKTYVPPNPDQIQTGTRHYVATIGNGSAAVIVKQHALGTSDLHVTLRTIATGQLFTNYTAVVTDQEITLTFPAGAPATNSLRLMILGAVPATQWSGHTHPISEVTGLEARLDELETNVSDLVDRLVVPGVAARLESGSKSYPIVLPATREVFPATIMRGKGDKARTTLPALPRAVYFLSPPALTAAELPDPAEYYPGGHVVAWDATTSVFAPGNSLRPGRMLSPADGPFIACDGYGWWPADKVGNVYYPRALNRTLWEVVITPEMLPQNGLLTITSDVLLGLVANDPELRASCMLRVRKGRTTAAGVLPASAVDAILWDTDGAAAEEVLCEQRLLVNRSGVSHPLAIQIARNAAGELSARRSLYGRVLSAPAPQNTTFVLRAELSRWDIEDYYPSEDVPTRQPTGQIVLKTGEVTGSAGEADKYFPTQGSDSKLTLTATITT